MNKKTQCGSLPVTALLDELALAELAIRRWARAIRHATGRRHLRLNRQWTALYERRRDALAELTKCAIARRGNARRSAADTPSMAVE